MEPGSTIGVSVLIGLVILNAALSLAHAALVNAHKTKLRTLADGGDENAAYTLKIAEDATRLLASHQLASILIRFIAASVLTLTLGQVEVRWLESLNIAKDWAGWLGYGSAILVGALLMVLFGDMIPSAIASSRPDTLAMLAARPMGVLMTLLSPLSRLMLWVSNRVAGMFGGKGDITYVTEEEIKTLVDAGSEEGVLEDEEKEMIYSIFQFGDTIAREIMIPRIDIMALEAEESLDAALDVILKKGHSRIPIYEDSIDNIIGLIYAKDLLKLWRDQKGTTGRKVREVIRPAYFVPESKKAGDLLADLQQRKIHLAIVVDEYGGTAGLVTIEDLIEEIVGDIQDEYDPDEEAEYTKITDDEILFDAGINLGEVNDLLDVELPTDESDTLGGYVFSVMGKVPLAGEVIRENNLVITVETITGRRIRKVRVQKLPTPAEIEKEREAEAAREKEKEKEPEKETGTHSQVQATNTPVPPVTDEAV